jgi:hypothetical protein
MGKIEKEETMGEAHCLHDGLRCQRHGIVGEVVGEDVAYQLSREKVKKYPMFFCCILCYVPDVSFISVTSEIYVGPQN